MAAAAASDPNALVRQGMNKFRDNDVEGSIEAFDAALAARPAIRPYLWQRGLSLYYVEQYQAGAQQVGASHRIQPKHVLPPSCVTLPCAREPQWWSKTWGC